MEAVPLNRNLYQELMATTTGLPHNHRRTRALNTFCMNIRLLAENLSSEININNRRVINYETFQDNFKPLFISKYDDDTGSNIYSKLNSFYPLTVDNHPRFSEQVFTNNFEFTPLISDNADNEQLAAEKILYKASILPMYPMVFLSTIEAHETFGPSFLNSFSISLSSMGSIPMVDISCSTKGGKMIEVSKPFERPNLLIETKDIIKLNSVGTGATIEEIADDFKNLYRATSMIDCLFDPNESHKTFEGFKKKMFSKNNPNYVTRDRIVEMSLDVTNEISFSFTQSTNEYMVLDDNTGPTFANLNNRVVSGSFTVFSISPNVITPVYESGITMYFGGPFFYPIPLVNWNNATVTANPGGGYLHKITFKAKLPSKTGFYVDNLPVSEFDIKFSDLANL
jgi:hypothetical protein